jgi:prefoldin beta subunit
MKINKETEEKIQELQILEQNFQNISLQRQAFQMELNETESALLELSKSDDEVYKIVGQIMFKANKKETEKELEEKKHIISLRLKSLDKQEATSREKIDVLRETIEKEIKK